MSNIASPMPQIRAKFTNKLGIPLSGCKVYTYEPNSDIPKTTWLDIDKTTENTNPILLDAAGEADIFLDGLYRVVVKDRFGFVVYDVEKTGTYTEWDASFVVYHGIPQKKINDGLESIAEMLAIQNPFNGMRVFVKSYYPGNGVSYLGEATPYKGGNWFIYKSARAAENDGVFIFNGWERFLESDTYTPYMAGCACDGVTDDAQNFDKLNFALQKNKLTGRIIIDKDMLINSELPRTGSMTHIPTSIKCGVRLVSGFHINILSGASIKIGSYFNDGSTYVFCAANPSSEEDWVDANPQDDVQLFGAGTIDSSLAGGMTSTHSTSRYLVFLGGCTNFHMYGLTTIGGDYGNILVARNKAKGVRFHDNHVKDTLSNTSFSNDHSSLWVIAPDCRVYSNKFTDSSLKARLIACAFESHGTENYFYNNTVDGYSVALLQCAYLWDYAQPVKDNFFAYGNTAKTNHFLAFWFQDGGVEPYGFADIFDNVHNALSYTSEQAYLDAGIKSSILAGRDLTQRSFITTSGDLAKDYGVIVKSAQQFRDNSFFASFDTELNEQFLDMRILFNEGLHIFRNYIKAPKLFTIKNQFAHLGIDVQIILRNYIFKDNDVDYSGVRAGSKIAELDVYRLNGCTFEVDINASYPRGVAEQVPSSINIYDQDNSRGNTISYTHNGQNNLATACSGLEQIMTYSVKFAQSNKVKLDAKPLIYVAPQPANLKMAQVFTLEASANFASCEVLSYSKDAFASFVLPAKLFKSSAQSDKPFIGVAFDYGFTNTSDTWLNSRVYARFTN
ncbi:MULTISPECIES: hypothetical protein [unclassified Acinetobacter]|uniref:hypothetical protein n=1 Tax=unclassified Acinetobacter TaxID=196816 RepID=UPI001F18050A|nr:MULTISPECIES: hypothetical protein [unclassified Acinetobacter]